MHDSIKDVLKLLLLIFLLFLVCGFMIFIAQARAGEKDGFFLEWTAPGDNGSVAQPPESGDVGLLDHYEMRYSFAPITDANFAQATLVDPAPPRVTAGNLQRFALLGLQRSAYYFIAIKTWDEEGNVSPMSNVALGQARDLTLELVGVPTGAASETSIFPNPANGIFHIRSMNPVSVSIYDSEGREVRKFDKTTSEDVDSRQMTSGVYFIRIGNITKKQVVIH